MRHNPCPRCGGQMIGSSGTDTSCLQCGHIVYPDRWSPLLQRLDLEISLEDDSAPQDEPPKQKPGKSG